MKKIVRRVFLATILTGAALVVRQVISDLSNSEKLWRSVTDEVE